MSLKTLAPSYYSRFVNVMRHVGSGERVLNVGCGDGHYNIFLANRFKEVYGIDVNPTDIAIAKKVYHQKNIMYFIASATSIPFPDNHFDRVVCIEVLEHVKDHKQAIREIARVLKPGGIGIVTVPSENYPFTYDPINWICERLFARYFPIGLWGFGHHRLYTMNKLERLFNHAGLVAIQKKYLLHFVSGLVENYYLINLLQPLTKSDPKNLDTPYRKASPSPKRKPMKIAFSEPPLLLRNFRDLVMRLDQAICGNSEKSPGIFLMVKKPDAKSGAAFKRVPKLSLNI